MRRAVSRAMRSRAVSKAMRSRAVSIAMRSRAVCRATRSRAKRGVTKRKKRCEEQGARLSMTVVQPKRPVRIHKKEGNKRSLSA
eukprot:2299734-Pleurochrysis_carterae.AAC.1